VVKESSSIFCPSHSFHSFIREVISDHIIIQNDFLPSPKIVSIPIPRSAN
jgi:hypothetical protein